MRFRQSAAGAAPYRPASSARVASLACCTFGSSNGLMSSSKPAVAVATSQRKNSAPERASASGMVSRMSGAPAAARPIDAARRVAAKLHGDSGAVASKRRIRRLAGDRHDALALLAGALGDELFDPEAERLERSGRSSVSLSRPDCAPAAISAPSASPGLAPDRRRGTPRPCATRLRAARRRRCPSARPAPGRRTTARSSGRRCRTG